VTGKGAEKKYLMECTTARHLTLLEITRNYYRLLEITRDYQRMHLIDSATTARATYHFTGIQ